MNIKMSGLFLIGDISGKYKIGLLYKGQKFLFHYDFGDDWMFSIIVSKIKVRFASYIAKSKGYIQQYSDFDEEE